MTTEQRASTSAFKPINKYNQKEVTHYAKRKLIKNRNPGNKHCSNLMITVLTCIQSLLSATSATPLIINYSI